MSRWLKSVNVLLEQLDGQVGTAIEERTAHQDDILAEGGGASSIDDILAKRGLTVEASTDTPQPTPTRTVKPATSPHETVAESVAAPATVKAEPNADLDEHALSHDLMVQNETAEGWSADEDENLGLLLQEGEDVEDTFMNQEESNTEPELVKIDAPEQLKNDVITDKFIESIPGYVQNNDTELLDPSIPEEPKTKEEETLEEKIASTTDDEKELSGTSEPVVNDAALSSGLIGQDTASAISRPALKDDPEFATYFRMTRMGMSLDAVQQAMSRDGMDPDIINGDLDQPAPIKAVTKTNSSGGVRVAFDLVDGKEMEQLRNELEDMRRQLDESKKETGVAQKETRTLRRHVISLNSQLESVESEMGAQRTELQRAAERMERDRARHKEEKETMLKQNAAQAKTTKSDHEAQMADMKKRMEQQMDTLRDRLRETEERRMQEGGDWTKELEDTIQREQECNIRLAAMEDETSTLESQLLSIQTQLTATETRLESVTQTAENAMEREREAEDKFDASLSLHARQLSQRQARESELERTVADLGAALVVARQRELNRISQKKGDLLPESSTEFEQQPGESIRVRLEETQDELENAQALLSMERQRCETLHKELDDVSKERTEEASVGHARQLQHDRQVADFTSTISRLQAALRDLKKAESSSQFDVSTSSTVGDGEARLQVASLSDQVMRQHTKIDTCTSEIMALKSRLRTAISRAEKAETEAMSLSHDNNSVDMEIGGLDTGMRRRGGGRIKDSQSPSVGSIRSAMKFHPGQVGEGKEKIGLAIDALDNFSVETGAYLRANPLARGIFILYLILLHGWTFFLLVFHAHNIEAEHGDFGLGHPNGDGSQMHHGPHALMMQDHPYRVMEQISASVQANLTDTTD